MDIELANLTPANLQQLKVINSSTLPVKYSDKFYNDLLTTYKSEYIKLAFCNGFSIGGVCARVEEHPTISTSKRLYIMTINVLAAYRKRGIATQLLNHVIEKATQDTSIVDVYLHVQVGNDEAKGFYEKHGFVQVDIIKDYYKKIEPADCYLLVRSLQK